MFRVEDLNRVLSSFVFCEPPHHVCSLMNRYFNQRGKKHEPSERCKREKGVKVVLEKKEKTSKKMVKVTEYSTRKGYVHCLIM